MVELSITEVIVSVGCALTTVIALLWRLFIASVREKETRLFECEDKHKKHSEQIVSMTAELNLLKGEMKGVSGLAKSVLHKLDEVINHDKT